MWSNRHRITKRHSLCCFSYEVDVFLSVTLNSTKDRFSDSQPDLVEDAVKYVIFLVDADRLFDIALGMYDFSLVLMVAQHAQKVIPSRLNNMICLTCLRFRTRENISHFCGNSGLSLNIISALKSTTIFEDMGKHCQTSILQVRRMD